MKASTRVAREIVSTMVEQGMRPGDRYLAEADGIERHRVGRGTYREALRLLESHGVVVMRPGPGGGPEIAQPGWADLASTFALVLQFAGGTMRGLLEARIAIEPGMAQLAARHAHAHEIERMAHDLDLVEASIGAYPDFNHAYQVFWQDLARSSHNALLATLSPALRAIVNSGGFVPNERYRAEVTASLREIHAAVSAHDETRARERMESLERAFLDRLTTNYPRQVDRVITWSDLISDL